MARSFLTLGAAVFVGLACRHGTGPSTRATAQGEPIGPIARPQAVEVDASVPRPPATSPLEPPHGCELDAGRTVALFARTVRFRGPAGMGPFIETSPVLAVMDEAPVVLPSCVDGLPLGKIVFAAAGSVPDDEEVPIAEMVGFVLDRLDYPANVPRTEHTRPETGPGRTYRAYLELPADPEAGISAPTRAYLTLRAGFDRVAWLVLEAETSDWPKLHAAFEATADTLHLLDPTASNGE